MVSKNRPSRGHSHGRDIVQGILEDFYAMRRQFGGRHPEAWQPPTDVYETDAHIVIKMCLPGVKPEDLAVEINGEVVSICGVRKAPDRDSVRAYHQMEIRNGYFERRVVLRLPFDPQGARGEYSDGFVYVHIPKSKEPVRHVVTLKLSL